MYEKFGKNGYVAEALDHYIGLENPQFAVLINGKWGSGKTWFIRKHLEHAKGKAVGEGICPTQGDMEKSSPSDDNAPSVFCYVSLFDITDSKEIDSAIIAQMNPVLFSESGKAAGRFGRFVLEKALPLIPINVSAEDISKGLEHLTGFLCKRPKNFVIVLDDLERSRLHMQQILGYASTLLEENRAKVILVCNSEEFKNDDSNDVFKRFREKIVAQTYSTVPDESSVFDQFINSVHDEDVKKHLERNKEKVLTNFKKSKTNNLRNIKKVIYDFSMIYMYFNDTVKKEHGFIDEVLFYLSILSIEFASGNEIDQFEDMTWTHMREVMGLTEQDGEKKKKTNHFKEKYDIEIYRIPFTPLFWKQFFTSGCIDQFEIESYYLKSKFNTTYEEPVPLQLWEFRRLDDTVAISLYEKMKKEISEKKYTDPGIILHAFSIMLKFSEMKIETLNQNEILKKAKKYVNEINLDVKNKGFESFQLSYASRRYHGSDSISFLEFYNYFKIKYKAVHNVKLVKNAQDIFNLINKNDDSFVQLIDSGEDIYYLCKFVYKVDCTKFAKDLSRIGNSRLYDITKSTFSVLRSALDSYRIPETITFIKNLCAELEKHKDGMLPLAKQQIEYFLQELRQLVDNAPRN